MTTTHTTPIIRQLPLRTAPAPGEAIDSWLDALAYRYHVPWSDLRRAVGSVLPAWNSHRYRWILRLTDEQAAALSAATGVDTFAIHAMTLATYPAIAVGMDPATAQSVSTFPWRHVHASRFCPSCLATNGGRWKLAWRMVWFFACPIHRCLLADHCPKCGSAQRGRHISEGVPQPGRCAGRVRSEDPTSVMSPCGADLTAAPVTRMDRGHPVLAAQAAITTAIVDDDVGVGIYRRTPQPVAQVLNDIGVLGRYFLRDAGRQILGGLVPADILAVYLGLPAPAHVPNRRLPDRASPAAATAVAVTAAMAILGQGDVLSAAHVLRTSWPAGDNRYLFSRLTSADPREQVSTVLRAVHLTALGPDLGTSDQLRCRVGTSMPRYPTRDLADAHVMATHIPTTFWPQWSTRLAGAQHTQRALRPALAVALLMVGSGVKASDAVTLLKCPLTVQAVNFTLANLRQADQWTDIRHALYRLDDHLRQSPPPIDYQRRRRRNYPKLLPETTWREICRRSHTRPEGISAARHYLFERLSSTFAFPSPIAKADEATYQSLLRFPLRLTPELKAALTTYSLKYLVAHRIADEPDQWSPPLGLLGGLSLPGNGTDDVDVGRLHHIIRRDGLPLNAAADRLGITVDVVRLALDQDPAPRLPRRPTRPRVAPAPPGPSYQKASAFLPPERFAQLYQVQGRSLRNIAATVGVCRHTIAQLARDYGVGPRPGGGQRKYVVDAAWLYHQHVEQGRSLSDLARETGIPLTALANRAQAYGVPVRRLSRHSAAALRANERVPKILLPALVTQGGWERLQRLPEIAEHASLTAAAAALESSRCTLGRQIGRIERDLGGAVLVRATDRQPLRMTRLGKRVVAAVNDLAARGGL